MCLLIFTPEEYKLIVFMFAGSAIFSIISVVDYINSGGKFDENNEINTKSPYIPIFMCTLTVIIGMLALYPS